jgi:hypothetical protein
MCFNFLFLSVEKKSVRNPKKNSFFSGKNKQQIMQENCFFNTLAFKQQADLNSYKFNF